MSRAAGTTNRSTDRGTRRRAMSALVAATALLGAGGVLAQAPASSAAPVPGACTVYASTTGSDANPGTAAAPFRTLARLGAALGPGAVGCLAGGTYSPGGGLDGITLTKGGSTTAPATIRSQPGATARFDGRLVVGSSASNLVIAGLTLNGVSTTGSEASSVTIDGDNVSLIGNDITAPTRICVSGGSARTITGLLIEGNRIHGCGDGKPRARQEHGVYLQQTRGAIVRNNIIDHNNTRGLQLFYDADGTVVENNVIHANGDTGINIGGRKTADGVVTRSEGNLLRNNIVAANVTGNVETYFDETLPVSGNLGNVFSANCFFGADPSRSVLSTIGLRVDADNRWVDPRFSNATAGDYRLLATSPCIGKGLRATTTARPVQPVAGGTARLDASVNPNRMTHNAFARVRRCTDAACTTFGPWIASASAQVVGMVDVAVSRTITGLVPGARYQAQWVTHQALLPASDTSALVVTPAGTFTAA